MAVQKLRIADYPARVETTVRFRDLDPFMHLNNGVYLSLFEEARITYINLVSFAQDHIEQDGILQSMMRLFPTTLVRAYVEYRRQAFLHQKITVGARVSRIKKSFIDFEYGVFDSASEDLLGFGETTLLYINLESFKPIRIPEQVVHEIERIENRKLGQAATSAD